jgi:hypothetical protein
MRPLLVCIRIFSIFVAVTTFAARRERYRKKLSAQQMKMMSAHQLNGGPNLHLEELMDNFLVFLLYCIFHIYDFDHHLYLERMTVDVVRGGDDMILEAVVVFDFR